MYQLIITQRYCELRFNFDDMESLSIFLETAMKHACDKNKYEIKKITPEGETE